MLKRPAWGHRNWLLMPAALVFLGAFAAPQLYFLVISFWSVRARIMRPDFTLKNYVATWAEYYDAMASTLLIALAIGAVTTLLAFGFAYAIRFKCGRLEAPLLFLALITLFGGYLVKIYAWKSILGREGILNQFLLATGVIDHPLDALLYSVNGVVIIGHGRSDENAVANALSLGARALDADVNAHIVSGLAKAGAGGPAR